MSGIEQTEAQGRFFAVVAELVPAVFDDLAGEPMRLNRVSPTVLEASDRLLESMAAIVIEKVERLGGPFERFEDATQLKELLDRALAETAQAAGHRKPVPRSVREMTEAGEAAIAAWSRKWHLTEPWCVAIARGVLDHWVRHPEALEKRTLPPDLGTLTPTGFMLLPAEIDLPAIDWNQSEDRWRHGRERRSDAKDRLLAKVAGALDSYFNRVEKLARARRYKEKPELNQHLEWLARYQIKGESVYSIAKTSGKERSTVQSALDFTADFIDLLLRPSNPRGKPKKNAD